MDIDEPLRTQHLLRLGLQAMSDDDMGEEEEEDFLLKTGSEYLSSDEQSSIHTLEGVSYRICEVLICSLRFLN